MRLIRNHSPYSLLKKESKSGLVWHVRFWNEKTRKYSIVRSTGILVEGKKERRAEAEKVAREILESISFNNQVSDKNFIEYVREFWTDNSPYVKECRVVKKKPLSAYYVKMNHEDVKRHIEPFPKFKNLTIKNLSSGHIKDWITWAAEKGMSGRRINMVLSSMRIAVRYAVSREELDRDPFLHIKEVPEQVNEKGVLSPDEAAKIINTPVTEPRYRLALLLGLLCGMRRGEIRGLQWQDIQDKIIIIRHNWQDGEGLKAPKNGSTRTVPVPASVLNILEKVRKITRNLNPESFVLESFDCPTGILHNNFCPVSNNFFRRALTKELEEIGISMNEQKRRNITFHALRHSFVTLGRLAGITDFEIQALAGHKSGSMMERYSHASQVINFEEAKRKLESVVGI